MPPHGSGPMSIAIPYIAVDFHHNSSPVLSRRTLFFDESPLGIYTLLRQTAMNQNKRVFEIAEAIISMADLFRTQQDT